jgi:photosystem II stability/assembly factor-like uncharacterized protein
VRPLCIALASIALSCSGAHQSPPAVEGGPVDGGPVGPAGCLPIAPLAGEWQPVQSRRPNDLGLVLFGDGRILVADGEGPRRRVLRTGDGGGTWCQISVPRPPTMLFSPDRTLQTIYAAVAPDEADAPARVLRSDDGGATWVDPGGTLPWPPTSFAALWPESRSLVAIVTHAVPRLPGGQPDDRDELWGSRDGGESWQRLDMEVTGPGDTTPWQWLWIARDPTAPTSLYALVTFSTASDDPLQLAVLRPWLLVSTDEGRTWRHLDAPAGGRADDAVLDQRGRLFLITASGQLLVRPTGAEPWKPLGALPEPLDQMAFGPIIGDQLYVTGITRGTPRRQLTVRSEDGGATWRPWRRSVLVESTVVVTPSLLYGVSGYGLRTTDGDGTTWRDVIQSTGSGVLGADGTGRVLLASNGRVLRSPDGGESWDGSRFEELGLWKLAPVPGSSDNFWAIMNARSSASSPLWLFQSVDGGRTWVEAALEVAGQRPNWVRDVQVLPTSTPVVLAATARGLARNVDGKWEQAELGDSSGMDPPMRFAPSNPAIVYVLGSFELYRSNDAGATWARFPLPGFPPMFSAVDLAVDPFDPETLFAIGPRGFVRLTGGGMASLSLAEPRAVGGIGARVLAVSARKRGTVVVARQDGKVLESSDAGVHWAPVMGLEDARVGSVMFDPNAPDVLYARTSGGLYRSVRR